MSRVHLFQGKDGKHYDVSTILECKVIRSSGLDLEEECWDERINEVLLNVCPEDLVKFEITHGTKYSTAVILYKTFLECSLDGNCYDTAHQGV